MISLSTLSMSPIQALTTPFDVVSGDVIELTKSGMNKPDRFSTLVSGESRQGFRIGEFGLMIRYEDGSELSDVPVIHRLPNTPDWFCGIANLHGKLIPVFDLAKYIGIDSAPETKRMLLVLSRGRDATGILIDGIPERLRIGVESLAEDAQLSSALVGVVSETYWIAGRSWMALQVGAGLDRLEHDLIATN